MIQFVPVTSSKIFKIITNEFKDILKIVKSTKSYVKDKLRTSKGCYKKDGREAMMAIVTACTSYLGNKKNAIYVRQLE